MATTQTIIALNQVVNSLLTGNAYTTLSTKAYLNRKKNGSCKFADFLDIILFNIKNMVDIADTLFIRICVDGNLYFLPKVKTYLK